MNNSYVAEMYFVLCMLFMVANDKTEKLCEFAIPILYTVEHRYYCYMRIVYYKILLYIDKKK